MQYCIETNGGIVRGDKEGDFYCFKGIPYGKAKRFEKAEPYCWDGVLDCTAFGNMAMQMKGRHSGEEGIVEGCDEDCLNLNIYTKDLSAHLPILVEIHGGAFQTGSNRQNSPVEMMRDRNFVYVSINYRLGIFGYLYLGEACPDSGNNGYLDQLLALRWVYANIGSFGGDTENITVMGASAGAKSIAALMLQKECKTLFSKAILSSGAYQCIRDTGTAEKVAKKYFAILGTDDIEELKTMDGKALLEAQHILCTVEESTCMFGPVADGRTIPYNYLDGLHSSAYWKGKAIVGSCLHELGFYPLMDKDFVRHAKDIAKGLFGKNAEIAVRDAERLSSMGEEKAWVKVLSDYMYRSYSVRMSDILSDNGSDVYQYSFTMPPALHCMDQSFAFGKEHTEKLQEVIFRAYTNFIISGDPNGEGVPHWDRYDKDMHNCMIWDKEPHEETGKDDVLNNFPEQVYRL